MTLPSTLLPWRQQVEGLATDLVLAMGPLIQRLAAVIGPFPLPVEAGSGEPDGFEGLARRGRWERLLQSEWLLADEVPDEFLRRAATSEHLFLNLVRHEPRGTLRAVALFDEGPAQLGAPRLAHLAALAVLAQRAEAAGASFEWGVLQDEGRRLRTTRGGEALRDLAQACSMRTAREADRLEWTRQLETAAGDLDAWLVGVGDATGWPRGTSRLDVREAEDPGSRRLHVRAWRDDWLRGEAQLALPEVNLGVRLLRDPTETPATKVIVHPQGLGEIDGMALGLSQRGLCVRLADGSARQVKLEQVETDGSTRRSTRSHWRAAGTSGPVIGLARSGPVTLVIARSEGGLECQLVTRKGRRLSIEVRARSDAQRLLEKSDGPAPFLQLLSLPGRPLNQVALFHDARSQLLLRLDVHAHGPAAVLHCHARRVLAATRWLHACAWVEQH